MDIAYFEDIVVGHKGTVGTHIAEKDEMIEFARKLPGETPWI
ncbi:MAG: hypothetical protein PHV74_02660 [Dehalococcoidia bacterium]|nr:hypothetical protein [Dehalococcoidia bacterium]